MQKFFPTIKAVLPHKKKNSSKILSSIRFKSYKIPHVAPFEGFKFYLFTVQNRERQRERQRQRERDRERERERLGRESGDKKI